MSPIIQPTIQPTVWENNPKLKNLLLVLIVVFFVSGMGLAFFAVAQSQFRQQVYYETEGGLPVHKAGKATGQITDSEISGWKTYTNSKYDFQIQYPTSVEFDESYLSMYLGGEANIGIQIYDVNSQEGKNQMNGIEASSNKISLNGQTAWQTKGLGTANNYFIATYFKSNKYFYIIQFSDINDKQTEHLKNLEQILLTFKFTK